MRESDNPPVSPIVGQAHTDWDARHIRALRSHLRLTQDEFSRLLNTRQQTVSEWEMGKHQPRGMSLALLDQIASASGFDQFQDVALLLNDWRIR